MCIRDRYITVGDSEIGRYLKHESYHAADGKVGLHSPLPWNRSLSLLLGFKGLKSINIYYNCFIIITEPVMVTTKACPTNALSCNLVYIFLLWVATTPLLTFSSLVTHISLSLSSKSIYRTFILYSSKYCLKLYIHG